MERQMLAPAASETLVKPELAEGWFVGEGRLGTPTTSGPPSSSAEAVCAVAVVTQGSRKGDAEVTQADRPSTIAARPWDAQKPNPTWKRLSLRTR